MLFPSQTPSYGCRNEVKSKVVIFDDLSFKRMSEKCIYKKCNTFIRGRTPYWLLFVCSFKQDYLGRKMYISSNGEMKRNTHSYHTR